jgi:hypothetical protein
MSIEIKKYRSIQGKEFNTRKAADDSELGTLAEELDNFFKEIVPHYSNFSRKEAQALIFAVTRDIKTAKRLAMIINANVSEDIIND